MSRAGGEPRMRSRPPILTRPMRRRPGHTLWEMILVLALLGVAGALAAPALSALRPAARDDDVSRTTRELTALLVRARTTALERGTTVALVLDPTSASYWMVAGTGDDRRLVTSSAVGTAAGVDLVAETPRARFVFTATGTAFGDRLLVRGFGRTRTIAVDLWSGAPHVVAR